MSRDRDVSNGTKTESQRLQNRHSAVINLVNLLHRPTQGGPPGPLLLLLPASLVQIILSFVT